MERQYNETFPDGTPIDEWFYDTSVPSLEELGKSYVITNYGVNDDGRIYTTAIQELIDRIAANGGGVVVVPSGTYLSGAIFFKPGVNLYVCEGGMLKGSDNPVDYPIMDTRIEGESCKYFSALINADGVDNFVIAGPGCIDGNGYRAWKAFRLRREWNPACTNKDEQRARLVYIANSKNVTITGIHLQNAQFWTTHLYKCEKVRVLDCYIYSPSEPIKSPSTDAIDIDVCKDVLVKNCFMRVNDDAVVLKGGKGPYADTAPENGTNERILVEDCVYDFCYGCLTVGSESVHSRNVLVRRIKVNSGYNLLWLKMRPDTPQHYEYITVEDVKGTVDNYITIKPWTQFFDNKGRTDIPVSVAENIVMRNNDVKCDVKYNVEEAPSQYKLNNICL